MSKVKAVFKISKFLFLPRFLFLFLLKFFQVPRSKRISKFLLFPINSLYNLFFQIQFSLSLYSSVSILRPFSLPRSLTLCLFFVLHITIRWPYWQASCTGFHCTVSHCPLPHLLIHLFLCMKFSLFGTKYEEIRGKYEEISR